MNHEETRKSVVPSGGLHGIEVRPIRREERTRWDELMRQYHYPGLHSLIGESIRYLAIHQGQWLALIGWSAAALKCKVRDRWIGWPCFLQYRRLSFVANNSRFLIFPHVRIPNLASYVLARNLKRLSRDWQTIYNHPIYLAETFVDPRSFKGTCYKAQGWEFLGYTRGFAKCAHRYYSHNQPKMVFVRPVLPDGKRKLSEPYLETRNTPKEVKPMRLSLKDAESLKERLSQIPDPRLSRGKRHRKLSVMTLSLCALLCSATSFAAIAEWAKSCSQNMLKRLGCRLNPKTGIYEPPSEPTIRRFLQDVDAKAVDTALYGWLQSLAGEDTALAIDGKTLKGAYQENGQKIHLLSAFLQQKGVVIAQCPVDQKTNEIPTLKTLLDPLDIKDKVVTLDALHTQKETARYLVEDKKADYLFTVKDNQPTLRQHIEDLRLVSFPPQHKTIDKHHGRIEIRQVWTSADLNHYLAFPLVGQVFCIHRKFTYLKSQKTTEETVYGITSLTQQKADPARILRLNRGHWSIENSLHYVRDVTFDEDRSPIRTNHAPRVMASLKNCIISIFRSLGRTAIAQTLRNLTYQPHLALKLLRL